MVTMPKRTGRTIADVWAAGTLSDRRAMLGDHRVTALRTPEGEVRARLEDWE